MPYLRMKTGADRGKLYEIKDKPVTIGRDRSQTIQILDQGVSRQHATIFKIGELFIVRDEGATNGTFVNNVKIQEEVLKNSDEVLIGSTILMFEERVSTSRLDKLEEQLESGKNSLGTTTIEIVIDKTKEIPAVGREIESKNLLAFYETGKIIFKEKDPETILLKVSDFIYKAVKADHVYLLAVDEQTHKFHAKIAIPDSKDLKVSRTIIQHVTNSKRPLLTTDATMDQRFTFSESVILRKIKSVICAPILSGDSTVGLWYFHSNGDRGTFTAEDLELVAGCVIQVGTALASLKKLDEARFNNLHSVKSLVTAMEMFDPQLQGHSSRVCSYAQAIAKEMSLSSDEIYKIRLAALLHDVGKLPVCLSQKGSSSAGDLSDERHVFFGEKMIAGIPGLDELLPGIKFHHERADGAGYPYHLKNADTPIMGRIIIVANAFDKLFATDSSKTSSGTSEILKKFAQKEKEFDPDCLKAILVCHRNGVLNQETQSTSLFQESES